MAKLSVIARQSKRERLVSIHAAKRKALKEAGDYQALDERLRGLLDAAPPLALGAAACMVAETLAMNGLMLRTRPMPDEMIPRAWPATELRFAAE